MGVQYYIRTLDARVVEEIFAQSALSRPLYHPQIGVSDYEFPGDQEWQTRLYPLA